MKVSEKKKQELYRAFSQPIFYLRVEIARMGPGDEKLMQVDEKLFKLEQEIWHSIVKVLDIQKL